MPTYNKSAAGVVSTQKNHYNKSPAGVLSQLKSLHNKNPSGVVGRVYNRPLILYDNGNFYGNSFSLQETYQSGGGGTMGNPLYFSCSSDVGGRYGMGMQPAFSTVGYTALYFDWDTTRPQGDAYPWSDNKVFLSTTQPGTQSGYHGNVNRTLEYGGYRTYGRRTNSLNISGTQGTYYFWSDTSYYGHVRFYKIWLE